MWPFRKKPSEPAPIIEPEPRWTVPEVIEPVGVEVEPVGEEVVPGVIVLPNGNISIAVSSIPQAKTAIKYLRLRKKEINLEKKELTSEAATIRAERSQQVASQGSMVRGGGNLGKAVRGFERMSRDSARRTHANRLAPLQEQKTLLDTQTRAIDAAILELERQILTMQHGDNE